MWLAAGRNVKTRKSRSGSSSGAVGVGASAEGFGASAVGIVGAADAPRAPRARAVLELVVKRVVSIG